MSRSSPVTREIRVNAPTMLVLRKKPPLTGSPQRQSGLGRPGGGTCGANYKGKGDILLFHQPHAAAPGSIGWKRRMSPFSPT
jgi:hypothetical protein